MNNQNIFVEVTSVENVEATERCKKMLAELLKAQSKVMKFLVSEGLDDTMEGEAIAEGLGSAIRAFDGILPQGVYDEVVSGEVAI